MSRVTKNLNNSIGFQYLTTRVSLFLKFLVRKLNCFDLIDYFLIINGINAIVKMKIENRQYVRYEEVFSMRDSLFKFARLIRQGRTTGVNCEK